MATKSDLLTLPGFHRPRNYLLLSISHQILQLGKRVSFVFFGFETWIAICRIATSDKKRAHHSKAQVSANNAILSPRVCPSVNVPTAFYKCHRGDFFLRLFAHWPVCCIQMSFYTCHNVISTWIYCLHYDIKDNTYELRKIYIGWAGSKDYIGSVSS